MFRIFTPNRQFLSVLFWIPASLILIFILAACGDSAATAPTASPVSGTTAIPATSSEKVTLTFGWWSNTPDKDAAYRAWLDQFQQSHPNITIKSEILPWGNYWDKVKATTAAGTAYDIIGLCSCQSAPYFANDQFVNLATFPDYQQVSAPLQLDATALYKWQGKQYGLPVGLALSLLGYNKDLLTAAGVPMPNSTTSMSFDDVKALAKKLTKTENGKVVQYGINPLNLVIWEDFVEMEGGQPYDNLSNPTKVTINNPIGIQGLTDLNSLFTEKIAPPPDEQSGTIWGDGDLSSLQTGKIGMARIGPWNFLDIMSKSKNIGIMPIFKIKSQITHEGANGYGIYKGSKHPAEAWEFLKWAMQTQNQLNFAKFSDVPVEQSALKQLDTVIQPKDFAPTLLGALPGFRPVVMTPHDDLTTTLNQIITDMERGKLTPAQAAAQMEKQGNAILSQ